eukprot:GHVR01139885.1.p1 GENE.GHVR01139885.1~~GHVR01139885.1.p1  ORF type:complete len:770 (-),score=133.30 GHVR01139885.1:60-2369(-)
MPANLKHLQVMNLKFFPRSLTVVEAQEQYYLGLALGIHKLGGMRENPPERVSADVSSYIKETVSIMPPLILQSRSPLTICDGGESFGTLLQSHVAEQVGLKCTRGYACEFPPQLTKDSLSSILIPPGTANNTNFDCVDRSTEDLTPFWDRDAVYLFNERQFPEIAYMFDYLLVKRSKIFLTKDWVDTQTNSVTLLNIFYTPGTKIGTLLVVRFSRGPEGFHHENTHAYSIQTMGWRESIVFIGVSIACATLAIIHCLWTIVSYIRKMKVRSVFAPSIWQVIFDVCIRVCLVVFIISQLTQRIGFQNYFFDDHFRGVLEVAWTDHTQTFTNKFTTFFEGISILITDYDQEDNLQLFAFFNASMAVFRFLLYMSAHPRIALLVNTVWMSLDDLFHFFFSFFCVYCLTAFIMHIKEGGTMREYHTFGESLLTQFKMLIGEWPWNVELDLAMIIYLSLFALIVYFTLMNFLLAIIVDAYGDVKKSIEDCIVEKNLLLDVFALVHFFYIGIVNKYPMRVRESVLCELSKVSIGSVPWVSRYELRRMNFIFGGYSREYTSDKVTLEKEVTGDFLSKGKNNLGRPRVPTPRAIHGGKRHSLLRYISGDCEAGSIPCPNHKADTFFDYFLKHHQVLQEPYGDGRDVYVERHHNFNNGDITKTSDWLVVGKSSKDKKSEQNKILMKKIKNTAILVEQQVKAVDEIRGLLNTLVRRDALDEHTQSQRSPIAHARTISPTFTQNSLNKELRFNVPSCSHTHTLSPTQKQYSIRSDARSDT